MAGQEEAKQLDSVTDYVEEAKVDTSKALEAMSALTSAAAASTEDMTIKLDKAAVQQLMDDFELTKASAEKVLRSNGGDLKAAARALLHSDIVA